jgi:hypothetical protein
LPELSECSHRFVEPISSVLPTELNLSPTEDPRVVRVRRFFQKHDCPVAKYSALFVRVADENKLDWRLLPTLAFLESTGGKNYKHNNIFGWNSGKTRFTSIPDGICLVARALSQYNVYAHKTTVQKIRVYNMHSRYLHRALEVMGEI